MFCTYRGIKMQICRFERWDETAIYSADGTDYLYTHYLIEVQCVYNPAATASLDARPIGRPEDDTLGDIPAISSRTLREWLKQPRAHLVIEAGGELLLESPRRIDQLTPQILAALGAVDPTSVQALQLLAATGNLRFQSDANNGPHPIKVEVKRYIGYESYLVNFTVETWLREDIKPSTPLISNRWTITESIDENVLSTLSVRGRAVFRADLLNLMGISADQFRQKFMFRPLGGFQRKNIQVEIEPTGLAVNYAFQDEQQVWALAANRRIVKVLGNVSITNTSKGRAEVLAQRIALGHRTAVAIAEAAARVAAVSVQSSLVGAFGIPALIMAEAARTAANSIADLTITESGLLPTNDVTFSIEIHGTKFATRKYLQGVCLEVAARLGFLDAFRVNTSTVQLGCDFPARRASLTVSLNTNGIWGNQIGGIDQILSRIRESNPGAVPPPIPPGGVLDFLGVVGGIFLGGAGIIVNNVLRADQQQPAAQQVFQAQNQPLPDWIRIDQNTFQEAVNAPGVPPGPIRGFLDFKTRYWSHQGQQDAQAEVATLTNQFSLPSEGTRGFRAPVNFPGDAYNNTAYTFQSNDFDAMRSFVVAIVRQALAPPLPDFTAVPPVATPAPPTPSHLTVFPTEVPR